MGTLKIMMFFLIMTLGFLWPSLTFSAYLEMLDGAKIYYEDQGSGPPIVLVHGWTCSGKFWQKNVPELAKEYRVVTIDLRGHGNSSKILNGHTITQYARDVREVMVKLGLRKAVLVGWSMGGPVVLSYYQQHAPSSFLKALVLIDTAPFPFSPAEWNSHGLKNFNTTAMQAMFKTYSTDPLKFATAFTDNMFKNGKASEADLAWIPGELTKTPAWIALAIYSDFLVSDYAKVLPTIKIPTQVFAANSNVFKKGIDMGKSIAAQIPKSTFVPFEDAGHLLFYEQPEKFNKALMDFIKKIK